MAVGSLMYCREPYTGGGEIVVVVVVVVYTWTQKIISFKPLNISELER